MVKFTLNRNKLAQYAALLGRDSIAAQALLAYDGIRKTGNKASIKMTNDSFEIWRANVREFPIARKG